MRNSLVDCCCCSVDIFFLDWEKPRRVLAKGGGREEPGPISAWRGLLVANEWNELQTARLTNPSFTLLFMVGRVISSAVMVRLSGTTSGWRCDRYLLHG
jgi:hypothetical protein